MAYSKRSGSRDGKTMVGAYVSLDALFTLQELALRLSREHRAKVTMQDFLLAALKTESAKHGVTLPD